MKKKALFSLIGLFGFIALLPFATYYWASSSISDVELVLVQPEMPKSQRLVPLFEVMIALPQEEEASILPELEYRKGPPARYLHRIVMQVLAPKGQKTQETVAIYGRRTRHNALFSLSLKLGKYSGEGKEARFIRDAILYSQNKKEAPLSLRIPYILEARRHLAGVKKVWIMEQAGAPAMLFSRAENNFDAFYTRHNSFYHLEFRAEEKFSLINPVSIFQNSFVTERRADALEYVARELSSVSISERSVKGSLTLKKAEWPLSLLAALVSLEPASLEGYFHFAGLNALLFKSPASDRSSQEILDILRNNVLVSEFYAKDVNPEADKTKEISRLARSLLKGFQ